MSPKLYRLYKGIALLKSRIRQKVSRTGRLIIVFAVLAAVFGINTRQTMIYQLAALVVVLLVAGFVLSFFFKTVIKVRRVLPQTCTAGERLCYYLQLENNSHKKVSGLFFSEISGAPLPTFEEFNSIEEEGEARRNTIDRKFGYYRWLWLMNRAVGARLESFALPSLEIGEKRRVEVCFTPFRRGYIQLAGYSIFRMEPLGLFKKMLLFYDAEKILVLPRLYPVIRAELGGSRRYHQGGLSGSTSCGDTGEFISLREYRPGDQVKHIDWKATARTNEPIVRQYQDEYFSRYGILLDTFVEQEKGQAFEDAVSVAASIIVGQDSANNLIDLLFAGDTCVSSISTGRGQSTQATMLEVLACITSCRTRDFSELAEMVIAHTPLLSGLILVLLELDEQRRDLIMYLKSTNVPHKTILITSNREAGEQARELMSLPEVVLFDVTEKTKVVSLV